MRAFMASRTLPLRFQSGFEILRISVLNFTIAAFVAGQKIPVGERVPKYPSFFNTVWSFRTSAEVSQTTTSLGKATATATGGVVCGV